MLASIQHSENCIYKRFDLQMLRIIMAEMMDALKARGMKAALYVALLLLLPAMPAGAETEGFIGEGKKKALQVVDSLMKHRRQDVREAEAAAELEAERKAAPDVLKKKTSSKAKADEAEVPQLRVVEILLKGRMPAVQVPDGTKLKTAVEVVLEKIRDKAGSVEFTCPEVREYTRKKSAKKVKEEVRVRGEVNISGCTAAEALELLCDAAACQYIVRGDQVVIESLDYQPVTEVLIYPDKVFHQCFTSQRMNPDPRQPGKKWARQYRITQKVHLRHRGNCRGVYEFDRFRLELTGSPRRIMECKEDLDELYHKWLRSQNAKDYHAQDPGSRRYKLESKMAAFPMVPVEFEAGASLESVLEYVSLCSRFGKYKFPARITADKKEMQRDLDHKLVIQHDSLLEALFRICDAFRGSYTMRGSKVTIHPEKLEKRRYQMTQNWESLLRDETGRFLQTEDAKVESALRELGIIFPVHGGASYDSKTNTLTVDASPANIHQLNRLVRYTVIIEND